MESSSSHQPPTERDALQARLDALASRRAATPPTRATSASTKDRPASRPKRRHAAKGARAAALSLSLVSTGGLATLFAATSAHAGTQLQGASIASAPQTSSAPQASGTASATGASAPAARPAVVDGGVFHNKWGDVQVEATFSDGQLVDVTTLQTPYRDGRSVSINGRAAPQLNAEALAAQNANVDTVSGATYTSNDYRRSLQSAIDTARSAGVTSIA
jgi:uncharacterized protein with FMN-binding domain